jgi:hypothetical protein
MSKLKDAMLDVEPYIQVDEVDEDIINMMNVGMAPDEIEEAIEMTHGTFWVGRVEEILKENVSD